MSDVPHGSEVPPPPGWYRDGPTGFRWWDGSRWSDYRAEPTTSSGTAPKRRRNRLMVAGIALLTCPLLATLVGAFVLIGTPYPVSRVGVSLGGDGLVIANAVCPGERILDVTLWSATDNGPDEELWRISGDAPMPEEFLVGSAPPGMQTLTELHGPLGEREPLALSVQTSELDQPDRMYFTVSDVPTGGILSFDNVYPNTGDFVRAVRIDTPCGDPYGKDGVLRFMGYLLISGVVLAVIGLGFVLIARRRTARSAP